MTARVQWLTRDRDAVAEHLDAVRPESGTPETERAQGTR